jgi:hypothetical protein
MAEPVVSVSWPHWHPDARRISSGPDALIIGPRGGEVAVVCSPAATTSTTNPALLRAWARELERWAHALEHAAMVPEGGWDDMGRYLATEVQ